MEKKKTTPKGVSLDDQTHDDLTKLSKKHGRKIKDFTAQMVGYFVRTGIDPADEEGTNLKGAIKDLQKENNRVIGFIKKQEKDKLNPILDEIALASQDFRGKSDQLDDMLKALKSLVGATRGLRADQQQHFDTDKREMKRQAIQLFIDYLNEQEWDKSLSGKRYVKNLEHLNDKYESLFKKL